MSTLHQILLRPTDVLFFRDGRPMGGSLAGHTAAWPLPDVTNHALHAALHRAGLTRNAHAHRRGRSGNYEETRDRYFGCLKTAGPFPVKDDGGMYTWYFPRPKDAQQATKVAVALLPAKDDGSCGRWQGSSLPDPLKYAVANTQPPTKESDVEPWLSTAAYQAYLRNSSNPSDPSDPSDLLQDSSLADTESYIGIAIDPATGTTGHGEAEGKIYSAHYLRLREGWRLGLFAECLDKINGNPNDKRDLITALLNDHPQAIIVGGQQRLCTATRKNAPAPLPLPRGLSAPADFKSLRNDKNGKYAVKWVLLTPAIWPKIRSDGSTPHPGGWLPNWVHAETGQVLLKAGNTDRQEGESREKWRQRVRAMHPITAKLVAAIVPKPIVVTGWALPAANDPDHPTDGGAKSTHLAVPAGAVYYFEADTPEAAAQLAAALNWHGPPADPSNPSNPSNFTTIRNRRSTLLGEKGYGLGVCGTWQFYP